MQIKKYTIRKDATVVEALKKLDDIPKILTLFIIDSDNKLIGTLTDGDIRRGIIKGLKESDDLIDFVKTDFAFFVEGKNHYDRIDELREKGIYAIPLINKNGNLLKFYDLHEVKTILPVDTIIMAGGKGERLRPLTDNVPKPLLKVDGKEIISYSIDRLYKYGMDKQIVIVNYLGKQIEKFCKGYNHKIEFEVLFESDYMGTCGSLTMVKNIRHENILLVNSDLLTNIDYKDFYQSFIDKNADMMVASVPYNVKIPYAIFETQERTVRSLKEKPLLTHYANAGIYLLKKEIIDLIPNNIEYNATDLMQKVIDEGLNLIHYPIRSYWLDIGKPDDLEKAQKDVKHTDFK